MTDEEILKHLMKTYVPGGENVPITEDLRALYRAFRQYGFPFRRWTMFYEKRHFLLSNGRMSRSEER